MTFGRRDLLRLGAGAACAVALRPFGVLAQPDAARAPVLVVLFMRGGLDGLSAVVPTADPHYGALRRSTALPTRGEGAPIDLGGGFGLHPRLSPLAPLYRSGALGVVHAVGSPDPTRSHFEAQHRMEAGLALSGAAEDGWLGRAAALLPESRDPLFAVATEPVLPLGLQGPRGAAAVGHALDGARRRNRMEDALRAMYDARPGEIADAARSAFDMMEVIRRTEVSDDGVRWPDGPLSPKLRAIARLLRAGHGVRIAWAEVGGWDTHSRQGGAQGTLADHLGRLADALAAFAASLGDELERVVLLSLSEFGRAARENGSGGTDHGHATVSFVLGGPVRGGRVAGAFGGLSPDALFEGRDLAVRTDFRDLAAEVLRGHLGLRDLSTVFPGHTIGAGPGVLRS